MDASRIAILTFLLSPVSWAADNSDIRSTIRVRIQDYAGINDATRARMFAVAEAILAEAGVAVIWLDCSPGLADEMDDRCHRKPTPQDLIVRLMPEKMAAAVRLKTACLGFALVPRNHFGTLAAVFVDKARRMADRSLARPSSVLGHAVAHEVAHLLLGTAEHSRRGLMQEAWSRTDLLRATASPLAPSKKETDRIRRNLRLRADWSQSLMR